MARVRIEFDVDDITGAPFLPSESVSIVENWMGDTEDCGYQAEMPDGAWDFLIRNVHIEVARA